MTWRLACASVIGSSHLKANTPCQDSHKALVLESPTGEHVLVCVASDGAGSAERSQYGSRTACESLVRSVNGWVEQGLAPLSNDAVLGWIFNATADITAGAESEGRHPRDFACTLVGAVITPKTSVFFQVGDGGVVARDAEEFKTVFWPEETESANLTFFITDEEWWKHAQIKVTDGRPPKEVSIFTDGLQLLVLDYAAKSPYSPFFDRLFGQMKNCPENQAGRLNDALSQYLASELITSRTDDDKTLVLATKLDS